jgi:leader peptidase (prepilin peptidase)/N-methyltransferase
LSAGDVKLAGALGIWMGWTGWPAAFFGLLLVHVAMALVLLSARIRGVPRTPLGPAIVAGVLVTLLIVGG